MTKMCLTAETAQFSCIATSSFLQYNKNIQAIPSKASIIPTHNCDWDINDINAEIINQTEKKKKKFQSQPRISADQRISIQLRKQPIMMGKI